MHRRNDISKIALTLILLTSLVCFASAVHAQATNLHDAATDLTKKLHDDPDVKKITGEHIVIAPFENINGKGDAVPRMLQEMLTTAFIKAKHFKVLERDQLQSALDELHFQLSDLADPAKAKKIGKLAGAAYVLLGSISDTGSSTSINARIVSIETGESVAAEDEDIKTGDAPLAVGDLNPALSPASPPSADPTALAPAVDLNTNANPTTAGQFTGKKDDFGLLGGTGFKIAWREDLGKDQVATFFAGDVLGDGTSRLVEVVEMSNGQQFLRILKWRDGNFDQTWESESPINLSGNLVRGVAYLCVSPIKYKPALISFSNSQMSNTWLWDGSTYSRQPKLEGAAILQWLSSTNVLRQRYSNVIDVEKWTKNPSEADADSLSIVSIIIGVNQITTIAGDFDHDGKIEIAVVEPSDVTTPDGNPIEIYGAQGRKAVTVKTYGARLTTWNPTAYKYPYIVACRNKVNDQGEPNGGYVYFIRWNREAYDEVWKSNRMGDAIIDMQVCDPKSEGKPGLIILSKQGKNYFLTKIVRAN